MKEATIYYHIGKVQALHNLVMAAIKQEIENKIGE